MATTSQEPISDLQFVDDFYFSALSNQDEDEEDHQIFPISDSKYAEQLQFQESLMSSLITPQLTITITTNEYNKPTTTITTTTTTDPGQSSTSFCDICADKKEPGDMLRIKTCSHSFCTDCISKHVAAKIQSNETLVLCPSFDCGGVLEFADIGAVVPPDVAARWDEMLCESLIPALEEFYCPFTQLQFQESLMSSLITPQPTITITTNEYNKPTTTTTTEPSQSSTSFCDICADKKEPGDMLRIKTCSHTFCSDCISKHVAAKIHSNKTLVLCPSFDCGGVLEFADIGAAVPPDVAARWDEMLCESLIPASEKFYCPFKDCSAMMVKEEEEEEEEGEGVGVIRESECPVCHRLFCARCYVGWHAGIECEEFQRLNEDERGREDLMVREMAKSQSWMRCPHCKFYVEKTEGCLHMTCRCGFQFCYACGANWSQYHGDCRPRP